jgi:hypothetical protein
MHDRFQYALNSLRRPVRCAGLLAALLVATATPIHAASPDVAIVTGTLGEAVADDFVGRRSHRILFLNDAASGQVLELKIAGEAPKRLVQDRAVTLRGRRSGSALWLDPGQEQLLAAAGSSAPTGGVADAATATTGEHSTLVMIANFRDASVSCPVEVVRNTMFTDPNGRSVAALYGETSLGQYSLSGRVVGPYAIAAGSADACDVQAWASAADAAALAAGIDPAQYSKKVYVLPTQNSCGYSGLATIGGSPGKAWVFRCDLPAVYAHEIGHTLGMNHAATLSSEYGDTSDFMGSEMAGLRQLNAPHLAQMGWRAPDRFLTVTRSGTYDIAPTELDAAGALAPQALRIAKPDTNEVYYVGYRQPIGFDAALSTQLTSRVQVHRYNGTGGRTWYLSGLTVGGQFVDSTNGVTITNLGLTPEYATVQVQFAQEGSCVRAAPTVSPTPSSLSVAQGARASFTLSIRNNDSAGCAASSFALATTGPSGWTVASAAAAVSLAPGTSGGVIVDVAVPGAASPGSYLVASALSDASVTTHAAATSVSVVVPAPCVRAAPEVALSPAAQTGRPGQSLDFAATVTNRDGANCGATEYAVAGAMPAGWSGRLSTNALSLSPGQQGQVVLAVASPAGAPTGTYGVAVSAASSVDTALVAAGPGTYRVDGTTDVTAPSVPGGLTARYDSKRQRVALAWNAATDEVGVAAYRVYRNGSLVGQTATTGYLDSVVAADTQYGYAVTAVDGAGNESAASSAAFVTTSAGPKRRR